MPPCPASVPTATTSGPDALVGALGGWARTQLRDLPWRRTRDPWAVLVSELMLQQTQVARVADRWASFLEMFPTPVACAEASPGEVIRAWTGLGYNRRALHLHRAARLIAERHGGAVPDSLEALLELPGVGAYTARAVLAFAHEHDVAVLDTNAARVLARAFAGSRLTRAAAQNLADSLVPAGRGWAWNQAMLDLGATVCTARIPACGRCPLRAKCAWAATGHRDPDPAEGSAGSSGRQSPFHGSDREGRGRLLQALCSARVVLAGPALAEACGWPGDTRRARRVAATLVADGLAETDRGWLRLAGS